MQIERFNIPDIFAMVSPKRADHRGFFSETYRRDALAAEGLNREFVQENHVYSAQRGVLRGLHFQIPPHAQGKLVRCVRGRYWMSASTYAGDPRFTAATSRLNFRPPTGSNCGCRRVSRMVT